MDEQDPEVLVEKKQTPNPKSVLLKEAIAIRWLSDRWELNIRGLSLCALEATGWRGQLPGRSSIPREL